MYVLRTMNSFKMSFWMVPASSVCFAPYNIHNQLAPSATENITTEPLTLLCHIFNDSEIQC